MVVEEISGLEFLVESCAFAIELKKGVKDHAKMEEFIKRVRSIEK